MRTVDQIMGDGLWPSYGSPAEGIRHTAIFKVLSEMLPEYVYQHLVQKAKTFRWFIPKGGQHFGQLQQFPATGKDPDGKSEAVVIYFQLMGYIMSVEILLEQRLRLELQQRQLGQLQCQWQNGSATRITNENIQKSLS